MHNKLPHRSGTLRLVVNHNPRDALFTLADVRRLACDRALLEAAAAWARRWHPRTTLARAA